MRSTVLFVALALTACGPALREAPRPTEYLAADPVCSSGPLEFHATLEGAQWGEYVRLRIDSPRAQVGLVRVLVDGRVEGWQSTWRTVTEQPDDKGSTHTVGDAASEHSRCLMPAGTSSLAAPPAAETVEVALPPVAAESEWQPLPAPSVAFEVQPHEEVPAGPLRPVSAPVRGTHFGFVVELSRKNADRRQEPPWREGAQVVIQVYSEQPNDYAGVVFTLEQGRWAPNVDAAAWQAELDRREADERRQRHYEEVDARRRAREAQRRADEAARAAREKQAYCDKHPDDGDCRPPEPVPRPVRARRPATIASTAPARVEPPKPHAPDGPPPPAPVEAAPPAPASYVEWVPGAWWWTGFEWHWLAGWWRVDEVKRRAVELAAAQPCPAPRVEAPPPRPVEGASWRAGVWVWSQLSWVWLPGGWARPADVHAAVPVKR